MTLLFSVLVLANALWSPGLQQGPLPLVIGGLGLAFLTAGVTLVRFGPGALAGVAAVMLGLNTLGLWAIGRATAPHGDVLLALIVEGYLLWSMLLLAGLTLHCAARSPRLAQLARDHGWNG